MSCSIVTPAGFQSTKHISFDATSSVQISNEESWYKVGHVGIQNPNMPHHLLGCGRMKKHHNLHLHCQTPECNPPWPSQS